MSPSSGLGPDLSNSSAVATNCIFRQLDTPVIDETYKVHPVVIPCLIFLSSVAVFFCLTTILAITIPLLTERQQSRGSSYNMYLVFLVIPELVYNSFLIFLFATFQEWAVFPEYGESETTHTVDSTVSDATVGQTASGITYVVPSVVHPFESVVYGACATSNIYMNAVISYEILKLLRNCKQRRRSKAPTLLRASLQAFAAYALGIIICQTGYHNWENFFSKWPPWLFLSMWFSIVAVVPIGYLVWVCICICKEDLLSYTSAQGRLKILVRYFGRIICLNVCMLFFNILYNMRGYPLTFYLAVGWYAMQVWMGFGLALTKPDVKENVVDLWTCRKVCFPRRKRNRDSTEEGGRHRSTTTGESETQNPIHSTRANRRNSLRGEDGEDWEVDHDDALSHWLELDEENDVQTTRATRDDGGED